LERVATSQRRSFTSAQTTALAELRAAPQWGALMRAVASFNADLTLPTAVGYVGDVCFLTLARLDGSDGTAPVDCTALAAEVVAVMSDAFAEQPLEELNLAHVDRNVAPPNSILASHGSTLSLTNELLDVDATTSLGRVVGAMVQVLVQRARLALLNIQLDDFLRHDFEDV
jgi:hypothetical protein